MVSQEDGRPLPMRDLLESTGIPFTVAGYVRGATLFRQGDAADGVMHIEKGRVRMAVMARSGNEAVSGLVEAGAFLGEEVLVGHVVRRQTATAMTETRVLVVLTDQLLHSCEQRLARALLVLAGYDERRPCRCVLPRVSQEIIAEMVGTTRSRVNVFMGRFKKLGFIDEDGRTLQVKPSLVHVAQDGY